MKRKRVSKGGSAKRRKTTSKSSVQAIAKRVCARALNKVIELKKFERNDAILSVTKDFQQRDLFQVSTRGDTRSTITGSSYVVKKVALSLLISGFAELSTVATTGIPIQITGSTDARTRRTGFTWEFYIVYYKTRAAPASVMITTQLPVSCTPASTTAYKQPGGFVGRIMKHWKVDFPPVLYDSAAVGTSAGERGAKRLTWSKTFKAGLVRKLDSGANAFNHNFVLLFRAQNWANHLIAWANPPTFAQSECTWFLDA